MPQTQGDACLFFWGCECSWVWYRETEPKGPAPTAAVSRVCDVSILLTSPPSLQSEGSVFDRLKVSLSPGSVHLLLAANSCFYYSDIFLNEVRSKKAFCDAQCPWEDVLSCCYVSNNDWYVRVWTLKGPWWQLAGTDCFLHPGTVVSALGVFAGLTQRTTHEEAT
jgi:hypothetical protein